MVAPELILVNLEEEFLIVGGSTSVGDCWLIQDGDEGFFGGEAITQGGISWV